MHKNEARPGTRYAVAFREVGGPLAAGGLELQEDRLVLDGRAGALRCELSVPISQVVEIRIGRLPADRLNGHRTLVIDRGRKPPVQVAPLGFGLLGEIADLVAALTAERREAEDRLVVVLPLRPGCRERAKTLLEAGPPLDPAALGLIGHKVYLGDGEAVFVFRGSDVRARVRKAMRNPALWRAGLSWQSCIAGRPQILGDAAALPSDAALAYSWPTTAEAGSA